jgi:hypothetical protein
MRGEALNERQNQMQLNVCRRSFFNEMQYIVGLLIFHRTSDANLPTIANTSNYSHCSFLLFGK